MVIKKRRTEVACIICGNMVKFPEFVGEDYKGTLLCDKCGSLLRIKLKNGEVKECSFFKDLEKKLKDLKGHKKMLELQDKAREALEKPEKNDKGGG